MQSSRDIFCGPKRVISLDITVENDSLEKQVLYSLCLWMKKHINRITFVEITMIRWMSSKTINVLIRDENIRDNLGVRSIENKMRWTVLIWFNNIYIGDQMKEIVYCRIFLLNFWKRNCINPMICAPIFVIMAYSCQT